MIARTVLALVFLGSATIWSGASLAAGALAAGVPADVAADGIALFVHVRARTNAEAMAKALAGCRTLEISSTTSKALCKIVATFSNQCAAMAIDPQRGTPGWGWAIANNSLDAKNQAIAKCRLRQAQLDKMPA
jgi:hypothetical protein